MSYRDIPKDRILKFPATPGFKGWKDFFTDESVAHPAKMNLNLMRHILKTYTKPGDVVLDPMAGTGSTIILASLLGRHGVAVEYEPRFCEMIRENIKRSERHSTLTSKGSMVCIQGDARELSKLLEESDAIITSPPYTNRSDGGKLAKKGVGGFSHYSNEEPDVWFTQRDQNNVANLRYGDIDAVVTSPPYGNRLADDVVQNGDEARMSYRQAIDSIVTSPPYEQTISRESGGNLGPEEKRSLSLMREYSKDSDNIGNLKSESYLEAMLQCYREFFKVLKEGGTMVLVTKNFIRDKAVVRLDEDTIKLCETSGFTLKDRLYFKLPQKSFWRILYSKRFPDVPEVEYEDVLVFAKRAEV